MKPLKQLIPEVSSEPYGVVLLILSALLFGTALEGQVSAQTLQHRLPGKLTAPSSSGPAQTAITPPLLELPRGTSLQVEISRQYRMKRGELIHGSLLHPLYAEDRLAIPTGTKVQGKVVGLKPDKKARIHARLRNDFTPFHQPEVQFDAIELSGRNLPIKAEAAADGAPVLQLSTPGVVPKKSMVARGVAMLKASVHSRVVWFTAPGFKDRAMQMLYHQLPYHPEIIAAHTAWSFELKAPLDVPSLQIATSPATPTTQGTGKSEIWLVNAVLTSTVTSANAQPGDPVYALVVEPAYDRNKQLAVPQGSMLVGKVTLAKAARSFGRNGKLRFTFQQVRFPEGLGKRIEGSLSSAMAENAQNLQMDAEGTVSSRSQSSVIAPLLLTFLAGRALDDDGNMTANTGVASNGFGLVGRVIGMAAHSRNLAAGIGFYAAGLAVYENFLRPGNNVTFPKDTRIEIETTPLRAPVLTCCLP